MVAVSFVTALLFFLLIGLASAFKSRKTTEDYLVAGKTVPAWLVALSAIATNNSGYMFIGMIGVTYLTGLSSIWLMFGWIVGDLAMSLLAVRKIRDVSADPRIHSFGGLLAHWQGGNFRALRRLSGLLTLIFLTLYAAAQLNAGSKATMVLLDWGPQAGIYIGAAIVLFYSIAGGIRASIWTDAAQSFFMIGGMGLLLAIGIAEVGGIGAAVATLSTVQKGYLHLFPLKPAWEVALFIMGWIFGGISVIGQPHIVIRFMSLDPTAKINRMRLTYYAWFTMFYAAVISVGLLCRAIFPETGAFDRELALPTLAQTLFPGVLQGIILAALFAATMSTADSLVLACSAALSRDFIQKPQHSLVTTKMCTFAVLTVATVIAVTGDRSVFRLVLDAWGLMAAAFVPLIVAYALSWRLTERTAMAGVVLGVSVFLGWQSGGLGKLIYSVAPAILAGFAFFILTKSKPTPAYERSRLE